MDLPVYYDEIPYNEKWKVRNEYIKVQDNKCYYCKASLDGQPTKEVLDKKVRPYLYPKQFFNHPVHLHHSHQTKLTLGVVHAYCNAVLWEYEGE